MKVKADKEGRPGLKMASGEIRRFSSENARDQFERVAAAFKAGWRPSKKRK